jgi:hypothetical protein
LSCFSLSFFVILCLAVLWHSCCVFWIHLTNILLCSFSLRSHRCIHCFAGPFAEFLIVAANNHVKLCCCDRGATTLIYCFHFCIGYFKQHKWAAPVTVILEFNSPAIVGIAVTGKHQIASLFDIVRGTRTYLGQGSWVVVRSPSMCSVKGQRQEAHNINGGELFFGTVFSKVRCTYCSFLSAAK